MKIYVGNLPFRHTNEDLAAMFRRFGEVISAQVITDRDTGRSRGFGFVEMDDEAGRNAIEQMDGADIDGRRLTVNEARPQQPRAPRSGGYGGGGGGGGYRGGGGGGGGRRDDRGRGDRRY